MDLHLAVFRTADEQRGLFLNAAVQTVGIVVADLFEGAIAVPGLNVDLVFAGKLQIKALVEVVYHHARTGEMRHAARRGGAHHAHIVRNIIFFCVFGIGEQPHDFRLRAQRVQRLGYVARIIIVGLMIERAEYDLVVIDAAQAARK